MKFIKEFILIMLLFFYVNNQVPSGEAINSCGIKNYTAPSSKDHCKEAGEICCYVSLTKSDGTFKRFCASTPSMIDRADVEEEINSYTGYTLETLECNNSKYIKYISISILLMFFILF